MNMHAPRAFNRGIYVHRPENVFYGTDDGFQDGSFGEYDRIVKHYHDMPHERHHDIHMVSVAGGLYFLNLLPLWRPRRITIFDINPMAITYARLILRVFKLSNSAEDFLAHLANADYSVENEDESFVQDNIRLKQHDQLPRERGSSKRSFADSWKMALKQFERSKEVLLQAEIDMRTEPMESENFHRWIGQQSNLWIYSSNITEFHFFDLTFQAPKNVLILQIIFPGQPQILDLHPYQEGPITVNFAIPLRVSGEQPTQAEELAGDQSMAHKTRIATNAAPPATGTYSQAIRTGDLVFVTGQTGRDIETGMLEDGLSAQTHRMLANIDAILNASGCRREDIVKVTLLLADIKDFKAVDQIYASWLPGRGVTPLPARTALQAAALPAGALVMLEVVAACPDAPQ